MESATKLTIKHNSVIKTAFGQFENLNIKLILFVFDDKYLLTGVLANGDIRREFNIRGYSETPVLEVMNTHFQYMNEDDFTLNQYLCKKLLYGC